MLRNISRLQVVGAWCALVLVIAALSVVAGAGINLGNVELLLVACIAPSAVLLLIWRGAPPATVAELLHSVNRPSKDSRS
jgi:hypothetical protein